MGLADAHGIEGLEIFGNLSLLLLGVAVATQTRGNRNTTTSMAELKEECRLNTTGDKGIPHLIASDDKRIGLKIAHLFT